MRRKSFYTTWIMLLILLPFSIVAQQSGILSDAVETVIEIGGKEISIHCSEGLSGKLRQLRSGLTFKTYTSILRSRRKKARAGSTKAKKQVRRIRKIKKAGDAACENLSGGMPTPTPTPSPSEDSYFERNGDVTPLGARVFEIPDGFQANAFTGKTVYESYCIGCHEKRSRATYPLLREAISQDPMFYNEELLPMQEAVDLTAYLNIFRTPASE